MQCDSCNGSGKLRERVCPTCNGQGTGDPAAHTCTTFQTDAEAHAFMMGYRLAKYAEHNTAARIDEEERNTVLLDLHEDDEVEVWFPITDNTFTGA